MVLLPNKGVSLTSPSPLLLVLFVSVVMVSLYSPHVVAVPIEDCCCDHETVDMGNTLALHETAKSLRERTFFRYFKVNLYSECIFWQDGHECARRSCSICECQEDEIPSPWKIEQSDPVTKESVQPYEEWIENDGNVWIWQDDSPDMSFVNLQLEDNQEIYTGFEGDPAHRIWSAIYEENCFTGGFNRMCFEERVFFRLISGLHSCISAHTAQDYPVSQLAVVGGTPEDPFYGADPDLPHDTSKDGPCLEMYGLFGWIAYFSLSYVCWWSIDGCPLSICVSLSLSLSLYLSLSIYIYMYIPFYIPSMPNPLPTSLSLSPHSTPPSFTQKLGKHPERIHNLYFALVVMMRAVNKAAPILREFDYSTGNPEDDLRTEREMNNLLDATIIKECSSEKSFDEAAMFSSPDKGPLLNQFKHHFRNISRIIDCVGCEKCRLHGKLQVLGLGTALKILFAGKPGGPLKQSDIDLTRNEVIVSISLSLLLCPSLFLVPSFSLSLSLSPSLSRLLLLSPLPLSHFSPSSLTPRPPTFPNTTI